MNMELSVTQKRGPRHGYPVVEMSRDVFEKLAVPPSAETLKFMPFGSVIRCADKGVPSPTIIGQLVKGEEAITSQWGAGLSLPERFLNRYEVELVER
jgi:hypothetical protein